VSPVGQLKAGEMPPGRSQWVTVFPEVFWHGLGSYEGFEAPNALQTSSTSALIRRGVAMGQGESFVWCISLLSLVDIEIGKDPVASSFLFLYLATQWYIFIVFVCWRSCSLSLLIRSPHKHQAGENSPSFMERSSNNLHWPPSRGFVQKWVTTLTSD